MPPLSIQPSAPHVLTHIGTPCQPTPIHTYLVEKVMESDQDFEVDDFAMLNAFVYTVFSSRDASIRPWASRFFSNLGRAEGSLTAMLSRAKKELLDSWVIWTASLLLAKQHRSLRSHLRRPSSSYTRDSILAWPLSIAEMLAQNYAPGLVALFRSLVSTPRQSQRERERVEQLEQRRDAHAAQASAEETAASPTPHIDLASRSRRGTASSRVSRIDSYLFSSYWPRTARSVSRRCKGHVKVNNLTSGSFRALCMVGHSQVIVGHCIRRRSCCVVSFVLVPPFGGFLLLSGASVWKTFHRRSINTSRHLAGANAFRASDCNCDGALPRMIYGNGGYQSLTKAGRAGPSGSAGAPLTNST